MVKEIPILFSGPMVRAILDGTKTMTRRIMQPRPWTYGQPGDRLWVRETWAVGYAHDRTTPRDLEHHHHPWYAAEPGEESVNRGRWRPSIHMPRWASRITLEVTSVRVERLQEITTADVAAEGMPIDYSVDHPDVLEQEQRQAFRVLWDQINAKRAPWDSNPWVWVIGFKRVRP